MEEQTLAREVGTPSQTAHCEVEGCEIAASARFGARPVCIEHFLNSAVRELDDRATRLKIQPLDPDDRFAASKVLANVGGRPAFTGKAVGK